MKLTVTFQVENFFTNYTTISFSSTMKLVLTADMLRCIFNAVTSRKVSRAVRLGFLNTNMTNGLTIRLTN